MDSGLLRFLTSDQRKAAVYELLGDIHSARNVQELTQLLPSLAGDEVRLVSDRVMEAVFQGVSTESDVEILIPLLATLPSVNSAVTAFTQAILALLNERRHLMLEPWGLPLFEQELLTAEPTATIELTSLEHTLVFLEKLLSHGFITDQLFDKVMMILLTHHDERITTLTTKVLRWRTLRHNSFAWYIIPLLCSRGKTHQITAGLILWLRCLISHDGGVSLGDQVDTEGYWSRIQSALTSSTHEHRKYALSILKLSIQRLDHDVDNALISFTMKDKPQCEGHWIRFCTLYEIVGVDTALNQAMAAHGDIIQLLSPSSHIKPSWGLALLCTGFKANMEAVRKYSLELMYAVPEEDVSIFAHDSLTAIFLHYALEASHFQVKKQHDHYQCFYGDRLEFFIMNLIRALKKDVRLESTISSIIELLSVSTTLYGPPRLYLANGLLKGLKGLNVLNRAMAEKVYRLFASTAEDEVFETSLQTVHLRLLKHLSGDVGLLKESLTRFIKYNGYDIFRDNLEFFHDFVARFASGEPVNEGDVESQVVHYALFGDFITSDEFLKELARSQLHIVPELAVPYSTLLGSLIVGGDYENSQCVVDLPLFQNSWGSVDVTTLYKSVVDQLTLDNLGFFSCVFVKVCDVSEVSFFQFEQLMELYEQVKLFKPDFKTKDNLTESFINIINAFLKMSAITEDQVSKIINILQYEIRNGVYKAYISTCCALQVLVKNYTPDLTTALEILESIWDHITAERLVLSQRDMHTTLIETIFGPELLKESVNNEYTARVLLRMGQECVQLSQSRRCLLPCLSRALLRFQRGYPVEFESCTWLVDIFVQILTLIQDDSNTFKMKNCLAEKYDKELSMGEELYVKVYGELEVSAKVNVISVFSCASQQFCDNYWNLVLDSFIHPNKRSGGVEELQRVLAFSSLLMTYRKVNLALLDSTAQRLMYALEKETSPWVRCYFEWIISLNLIKTDVNRNGLFELFQDQGKPTLVTSAERIGFLVAQKLDDEGFFDEFTKRLIPNCASNKPLVRHFSNSLTLSVYPEVKCRGFSLQVDGILKCLYDEARKSEITGKFRTGDALLWDVYEDFNLVSIFGGVLSRVSPRPFEVISKGDIERYIVDGIDIPVGEVKSAKWAGAVTDGQEVTPLKSSPLQTKSGAWESVLDVDQSTRTVKRSELIVVSSLVDKPPNLGGICRLCDVLGAGVMTVDDLRVKKDPQFQAVAVTADYWMPLEEVKVAAIPQYLRAKKREGYTLIGLEQTDRSVVLSRETGFPAKSLILLGKEAEGIPGELLAELDFCVEIRQTGVIRSMNIQTAAAVLVHAYATHHS